MKRGLMHVPKVLSHISLCSLHRLIRDNTFQLSDIFHFKKVPSSQKSSLGGKCDP